MSLNHDDLYSFINNTPTLSVIIEAKVNLEIANEFEKKDYFRSYTTQKTVFRKIFNLPKTECSDLKEHQLSANLKYNEYVKCNSKLKIFKIHKNIIAPYKLIEKLIKDRLNVIDPILFQDCTIKIIFDKQDCVYSEEHNSCLYECLQCFIPCNIRKYFILKDINYRINRTEEQWNTFISAEITKDDITEYSY